MDWILFYYNSLPEMPKGCSLFSQEVMHRDFFRCNPFNTGHYQYPKFERLSYDQGCHEREVLNLKNRGFEGYVLFYTRHTTLSLKSERKVVGYFRVDRYTSFNHGGKELKGFRSSETVLLSRQDCIIINYAARGVPVSWGSSTVKNDIDNLIPRLNALVNSNQDVKDRYQMETRAIVRLLSSAKGRSEVMDICNKCPVSKSCFWGRKSPARRVKTLKELYEGIEWSC